MLTRVELLKRVKFYESEILEITKNFEYIVVGSPLYYTLELFLELRFFYQEKLEILAG